MRKLFVNEKTANQKITRYLRKVLDDVPLSTVYKLMREKDVKVNGKRVNKEYIVKNNDIVEVYLPEKKETDNIINKTGQHFDVVYEDENVLFVNKRIGITVQKDIKNEISLTEEVIYYLYNKGEYDPIIDKGFTPAPAHRLDRNTCGIVMFGKKNESLKILTELLRKRERIVKKYRALVFNRVLEPGVIDLSLVKNEKDNIVKVAHKDDRRAKSALTSYTIIEHYGNMTLLDITLHSGRTHQIRAHMAAIGYPLVGDNKYGDFSLNKEFASKYKFKNQFLQSYEIRFKEVSGLLSYLSKKSFRVKIDEEHQKVLRKIRQDFKHY